MRKSMTEETLRLQGLSDDALVSSAKRGEHSAFTELWHRHSGRTFTKVYRITVNRQDAEDALQDCFLSAFTHLETFDGRSQFSTWLTRIAINSALMILRRRKSRPSISMDSCVDGSSPLERMSIDPAPDAEAEYLRLERVRRLKQAIDQLHPRLRGVVELRVNQDHPLKDISARAGISLPAVKARLIRARGVLRQSMERTG
jgi:RNA polymerase sigma factor (sigma-70 family)